MSSGDSLNWTFLPESTPKGTFREGTRAAVEAFQYRRGLRVDGVCGRQTWSALVEAGRRLGDRFLYRRSPMLRGDDVAELQQRLSALGFDTGSGRRDLRRPHLGRTRRVPAQRRAARRRHRRGGHRGGAAPLRFATRRLGAGVGGPGPGAAPPGTAHAGRPAGLRRRGGGPRVHRRRRATPAGQPGGPGDDPPPSGRVDPGLGGERRRGRGVHRHPARHRAGVLGLVLLRATATPPPAGVGWPSSSTWRWPRRSDCPMPGAAGCPCRSCARPGCRR